MRERERERESKRKRVLEKDREKESVYVIELRTQACLSEKKLVTFLKGTLKRLILITASR